VNVATDSSNKPTANIRVLRGCTSMSVEVDAFVLLSSTLYYCEYDQLAHNTVLVL
jgi:hypothetical protein